jgi:hypothetical protein
MIKPDDTYRMSSDRKGWSFDSDSDLRLDSGVQAASRIRILGGCVIDGTSVKNTKTMEFVVALAVSGGSMSKSGLLNRIYEADVSQSTLPTLAYRVRKLGIDVGYDPRGCRYILKSPVIVDALTVIDLVKAGRPRDALRLYRGPCLPGSDSPFAGALRHIVEAHVVRSVLDSEDDELIVLASGLIDNWELAERAAANTQDPCAAILSCAYLHGAGLISAGQS